MIPKGDPTGSVYLAGYGVCQKGAVLRDNTHYPQRRTTRRGAWYLSGPAMLMHVTTSHGASDLLLPGPVHSLVVCGLSLLVRLPLLFSLLLMRGAWLCSGAMPTLASAVHLTCPRSR